MQTDILIIGGGLSGLSLAQHLEKSGRNYQLIEARDRFGGRIKSAEVTSGEAQAAFDLGPAWFWPGQPRMAALVKELGLKTFTQYSTGSISYEDEQGRVARNQGFASMQGSYRLEGSLSTLVNGMADTLPSERHHLQHTAQSIIRQGEQIATRIKTSNGPVDITSKQVVLALPPRVVAETIDFADGLPSRALQAMQDIPTWMAGHGKIMAVYDTPFWRESGFSGDAISRRGPMVEVHDASPATGGPYALFGFLGWPAEHREGQAESIKHSARDQLVRLFGNRAGTPLKIIYQDWAFDPMTASRHDHAPLRHHPSYGLPHALSDLWGGALQMASTEVAPTFGGYLEGALESAEQSAQKIKLTL